MTAARVIAARELRGLFVSPLAWTLLAVLQALAAWLFLVRMDAFAAMQPRLQFLPGAPGLTAIVVTPLLRSVATLLMLLVPIVTMRMLSGDRRDGGLVLLLAAPVSAGAIVLGKFVATTGFFVIALGLLSLLPFSLLSGGSLDAGLLVTAMLGMVLLVGLFAAVGLYCSSRTAQPGTAAVAAIGALLLAWSFDWTAGPRDGAGFSLLAWLSPAPHLDTLLRGLLSTADIAYFVLLTIAFLFLAAQRVEGMRSWD